MKNIDYKKRAEELAKDNIKLMDINSSLKLENKDLTKQLRIGGIIERFSSKNLQKLQKHFVDLYGSDEMAQEKANSFAVGFGKACELIIKDINAL